MSAILVGSILFVAALAIVLRALNPHDLDRLERDERELQRELRRRRGCTE